LDDEFLALAVVFMLIGVTGILLFGSLFSPYHSITPVMECSGSPCSNPDLGDSCFCLISSPEPGAAQGTSSILLALGVLFFPMGLMKGGLPTFRKGPVPRPEMKVEGGKVAAPPMMLSGSFFAFGLIVLLVGVDAVLVPGLLVYKNFWYELAGALLTAAGVISVAWGLRKPGNA
jgi:hypothetical protein